MRRFYASTTLILLLVLLFIFSITTPGFTKEVIKLAHHLPPKENRHLAVERFAKTLAQKTNGAVEVQIHPGGSLGNERDNLEGVRMGTIQMSFVNPATTVNFEPLLGVLDMPFLFRDIEHVHKVLDGPIGDRMAEALRKTSEVRVITWFDTIFRVVLTTRPINRLEDFKGLKIRVPESPVYTRIFRLLGANPTPLPWGDIYTALQTKVVEGMESAPDTLYNSKLHEVAKYLALTRHIYNCTMLVINDKYFQGLSPDVRKAIMDSARDASLWLMDVTIKSENEYYDKLKKEGVKITTPDLGPIRAAVQPIHKEYGEKLKATALIEEIAKTK
jgi:tripartite ATP-independent transporter DctP family solute receptor